MSKFNPIIEVENDGLYIPEVREWSLEKYKLLVGYCEIFTNGMKNKWDQLVYIDLFAGAGYSRIKETGKIYLSSALIAMSVDLPFGKYILCEKDEKRFKAIKERVFRDFGNLNVKLIHGDSNEIIQKVIDEIPSYSKFNTVLSFCFVDPFSLNLNFETIKALSTGLMDFLILQALHMDANRNLDIYLKEKNTKIAKYLGLDDWRRLFEKDLKEYNQNFVKFLADQYQQQMTSPDYVPSKQTHQIRSNLKNLPLYYLAFYSKHRRGVDFFKKAEKYISSQYKLDF